MDAFSDVRSGPKYIPVDSSLIASRPSQDTQKHMLGKEWLTKVDNETSTPYLLVGSVTFIIQTSPET